MGAYKNMAVVGIHYFLCGVKDQRLWNDLMLCEFGISVQPLLDKVWLCASTAAKRRKRKHKDLKNCWEFMGCQQGGGKCRASNETKLHGIHGGDNAGRACWGLPRTMCRKASSATAMEPHEPLCEECPFFQQVVNEQGSYLLEPWALRFLLRKR